jgi:AcrR family transcriptional regulator
MSEGSEKRTRMSGEERRASMLLHARGVFARRTYAEATTGELARACEVTEPMLYKHFGSKKGLFMAVLQDTREEMYVDLNARTQRRAQVSALNALEHFIEDYRLSVKINYDAHCIMFQAISEAHDPDIVQCLIRHNRRMYDFIRELVEQASQSGQLDPAISTNVAAWGYMCMILALQYGLLLNLGGQILSVQDEMARIWFRGLQSPVDLDLPEN